MSLDWSAMKGYSYADGVIFIQRAIDDRVLYIQYNGGELSFYDSNGTEYDSSLYLEEYENPIDATKAFVDDQIRDSAGFLEDDESDIELDHTVGPDLGEGDLWNYLKSISNGDREIIVHTYGNKFKQYKHYNTTQKNFNALVIQSSKTGLNLRGLRGTDPELQKSVASGKRFSEVMTRIVTVVEKENLNFIGIYCRAGHHRSVACAELLKAYVYPRATIKHLTIHK